MQTTPSTSTSTGEPAAPYQPASDDDAREAVFAIIGSDLCAPAAFTGDWHEALRKTADRWSTAPTPA
ncbi:hypothetical protein ACWDG9_17425 [Streptomyces sp. NPDC001073]